jgi:hypothetical protein
LRRATSLQRALSFFAARVKVAPSYSASDLVAVALVAAVVAVWAEAAGGSFSFLALLACEAAFLAFYLVGSLLAGWQSLTEGILFDLPLRLLVGYAMVNTALLALAWFSPLGIIADFGVVFAIAALLFLAARPGFKESRVAAQKPGSARTTSILDESVDLLALGVSLAAATLWCQDSLHPISVQDSVVVFKPWIDSFYHAGPALDRADRDRNAADHRDCLHTQLQDLSEALRVQGISTRENVPITSG